MKRVSEQPADLAPDPVAERVLRSRPVLRSLWLLAGVLMLGTVLAICLMPLSVPPSGPVYNDKVMHVLTFIILTVWFAPLTGATAGKRRVVLVLALTTYGILIEFLQSFTEYRSAEFADLVADVGGILLGVLLLKLGLHRWPAFVEHGILRLPVKHQREPS